MITIDYHGNASLQFMDFLACGCHVSDTRRKNLFGASIKTDIVFDVKRIAKEWNKKSKIKYLNRYIVFNGNGVMFHGMMNGLSSLFVEKTKYKRMLQ